MTAKPLTPSDLDLPAVIEGEEIDRVLAALRQLAAEVSSPVVRLCLQEAHADIAHLAAHGPRPEDAAA